MKIFLCSSQPTHIDGVSYLIGPIRQNFIVVASSEQEARELLGDENFDEEELKYVIFQEIPSDEKFTQFCGAEFIEYQEVQVICEQNNWDKESYVIQE